MENVFHSLLLWTLILGVSTSSPPHRRHIRAEIQNAIQGLQANAYAFGKDCIHADASRAFLAMETDFNITLHVTDTANEAELGE